MTTRSGYAEINGARIYYEVAGSGEPVVFVHGFSLDTRMWDDQVDAFAREFEVIRYDVRGFGRSGPGTSEPFSSVDDLKALLDYLGHRSAHVVGLSMGGGIATSFAAVYPEATRSLVPVDSNLWGYRFSEEWNQSFSRLDRAAAEADVAASKELWLAHPLFAPANARPDVAARLRAIVGDYSGWHWLTESWRGGERGLDPPTIERLSGIPVPTLVVLGERDLPDFQAIADCLSTTIPKAHKAVLPGVGHMSNMEDPAAFNEAVLDFLRAGS
jgi:pimeloyl-ACP methyl ester carboxylesterase